MLGCYNSLVIDGGGLRRIDVNGNAKIIHKLGNCFPIFSYAHFIKA